MKIFLSIVLLVTSLSSLAGNAYPRIPDLGLTPGSLCQIPESHRYPEQIAYCGRALNSYGKEAIFFAYRNLGYSLSGDRAQYKVDHFIPLCAGGSNEATNLWPQYYTISALTDALEPLGCEVLALGRMSQKDVIELIMKAKLDPKLIPQTLKLFKSLKAQRQ